MGVTGSPEVGAKVVGLLVGIEVGAAVVGCAVVGAKVVGLGVGGEVGAAVVGVAVVGAGDGGFFGRVEQVKRETTQYPSTLPLVRLLHSLSRLQGGGRLDKPTMTCELTAVV